MYLAQGKVKVAHDSELWSINQIRSAMVADDDHVSSISLPPVAKYFACPANDGKIVAFICEAYNSTAACLACQIGRAHV